MLADFKDIVLPEREIEHFGVWVAGIVIATLVFALGTIYYPVLSNVFFVGILAGALIFFNVDMGILVSIFFFFLLFRLELHFPARVKDYVEVIYIGSSALVLATYLLWQLRKFSGLENRSGHNPVNALILFFIFWGVVSLSWTGNIHHGINLLFTMTVNLIVVYLLSVFIQTRKDVKVLFKFIAAISAVLTITTVFSKWYLVEYSYEIEKTSAKLIWAIGGDTFGVNPDNMRAAGFAPANHAAFALNIFLFSILPFVFHHRNAIKKIKYILVVIVLVISMVLSGSKGGFGSMLLGLGFVLLTNPGIKGYRVAWCIFFGGLIIFSIAFALALGEERIKESAKGGASSKITSRSFSSRFAVWKRGFSESDNNFSLVYGYGMGASASMAKSLPHMHSFYFSALLDMGIVGLALYLSIILCTGVRLLKCILSTRDTYMKNLLSCLSGALVAAVINGLVMAEFSFPFFWILLGLVIAVTNRSFDDNKLEITAPGYPQR